MKGVVAAATLASAVLSAQEPATFRAGVDLVLLSVAVTEDGRPFANPLGSEDFVIVENGRQQTQVVFEPPGNTPLTVSLLVDTSASMTPDLRLVQDAVVEFVNQMRPGDRAQIIDFNRSARVIQPFTDDRAALRDSIRTTQSGGTTALYDAIALGVREIEQARRGPGTQARREAIVVLTDGNVTSGNTDFERLLDSARRASSAIYAISVEPNAERNLQRLADDTGGRLLVARDGRGLATIYRQVVDELNSVYVLGYESNDARRSGWRRIEVRMRQRGLEARTRSGYFASVP